MPRSPNNQELAKRREKVAQLYLQGQTQRQIAATLGIDQGNVCRDLEAVRKVWLAAAVAAIDQRKAEELARVDQLEATYWTAWDRSQQPRPVPESTVPTPRDGNPAFLVGVKDCIELRCKILGILVKKLDHTSAGEPITLIKGVPLDAV